MARELPAGTRPGSSTPYPWGPIPSRMCSQLRCSKSRSRVGDHSLVGDRPSDRCRKGGRRRSSSPRSGMYNLFDIALAFIPKGPGSKRLLGSARTWLLGFRAFFGKSGLPTFEVSAYRHQVFDAETCKLKPLLPAGSCISSIAVSTCGRVWTTKEVASSGRGHDGLERRGGARAARAAPGEMATVRASG